MIPKKKKKKMKITKNNLVSEGRKKERERGRRSARSKLGVVAKQKVAKSLKRTRLKTRKYSK